jgi:hypothetical protein
LREIRTQVAPERQVLACEREGPLREIRTQVAP